MNPFHQIINNIVYILFGEVTHFHILVVVFHSFSHPSCHPAFLSIHAHRQCIKALRQQLTPSQYTTRFYSFTDRNIPSVCDQKIIYQLYYKRNPPVRFLFVGDSIFRRYISRKNKKITFVNSFTDCICAPKKKVSRLNYTDGINSVGDIVYD